MEAVRLFVEKKLSAYSSGQAGEGGEKDDAEKSLRGEVLIHVLGFDANSRASAWLRRALEAASRIVEEEAGGYSAAGYAAALLYYRLEAPGLVGAGGGMLKPVFEVGLSIDPVLGLPYYPGSGVKGAVRALAEELLGEEAAGCIFGRAGEDATAGAVVFGDMLPVGCGGERCSVYRGLVVTPHYHEGGEPVAYELDAWPVPVQHMGIEEGLVFAIPVAVHPARAASCLRELAGRVCPTLQGGSSQGRQLLQLLCGAASRRPLEAATTLLAATMRLLDAALEAGIAARSTKGYNVFKPHEEARKEGKTLTIAGYRYVAPEKGGGKAGPQAGRHGGGPRRGAASHGRGPDRGRRSPRRGPRY